MRGDLENGVIIFDHSIEDKMNFFSGYVIMERSASVSKPLIMLKKNLLTAIILLFYFFSNATDYKKTTVSTLKSVTICGNGAEMINVATSGLGQGNSELIMENISNQVDINSIQINCP